MIDSPRNARIQAALALRERSERLASGMTIVDGTRECRRAVEAGVHVDAAFVCRSLLRTAKAGAVLDRLRTDRVELVDVSLRVHDRLAFGNRGDGLVLVVKTPSVRLDGLRLGPTPLVIVTEDVEKPGNLGAILRTADGAGCDAVIAVGGTDLFNPNVIRASVGIVFSLPVASGSAADVLAWLTSRQIRPVAARVDGETAYDAADLTGPLAIVLGSEAAGLSAAWHDPAIRGVRLPMLGVADSLNVSVAAAVIAFEARRQRDAQDPGTAAR